MYDYGPSRLRLAKFSLRSSVCPSVSKFSCSVLQRCWLCKSYSNTALLLIGSTPSAVWASFSPDSHFLLALILEETESKMLSLHCLTVNTGLSNAMHWLWYSDTYHPLHDPVWLKRHLRYTVLWCQKVLPSPFPDMQGTIPCMGQG